MNVKGLVFKSPKVLLQGLASSAEGIDATKVIQTYVLENAVLKVNVMKDGKSLYAGEVKWIGNRLDGAPGCVICAASGKELRLIEPSDDTVNDVVFDSEKFMLVIDSAEKTRCSVCGKGLRIFDQNMACPLCGSKAHSDHLSEWIKMRHSCPICKKELDLDRENKPIPKE